ncbi:hypothetical protein [Paenibacillus thiaminolyticus]|uniref:hypothetical protein n=1 Tax=Paenibacillus thiaminolyticus TaxID=49283 RepID=UPI0016011709|nr:hypothetical protein [Paenibacillus thiaminolyticus]
MMTAIKNTLFKQNKKSLAKPEIVKYPIGTRVPPEKKWDKEISQVFSKHAIGLNK